MTENSVSTPSTGNYQQPKRLNKKTSGRRANNRDTTEWGKYLLSVLILAIGGRCLLWLVFVKGKKQRARQRKAGSFGFATESIQPFAGELDMTVSGSVVPFREIRVAAKVSGNVVKKHPKCEAGHFVNAGEPLIEIDPSDFPKPAGKSPVLNSTKPKNYSSKMNLKSLLRKMR